MYVWKYIKRHNVMFVQWMVKRYLQCFPENKTGSYLNFRSKDTGINSKRFLYLLFISKRFEHKYVFSFRNLIFIIIASKRFSVYFLVPSALRLVPKGPLPLMCGFRHRKTKFFFQCNVIFNRKCTFSFIKLP